MINETIPNLLRTLASQTIQSHQLSDFIIGEVIAVNPLKISISEKETIYESECILSDAVKDYFVDITVSHITEPRGGGGGYAEYASHDHGYRGRKTILVHNGLVPGEQVVLFKQTGGQLFYVASRVDKHKEVIGQWL